jgi:hypothetical protein
MVKIMYPTLPCKPGENSFFMLVGMKLPLTLEFNIPPSLLKGFYIESYVLSHLEL